MAALGSTPHAPSVCALRGEHSSAGTTTRLTNPVLSLLKELSVQNVQGVALAVGQRTSERGPSEGSVHSAHVKGDHPSITRARLSTAFGTPINLESSRSRLQIHAYPLPGNWKHHHFQVKFLNFGGVILSQMLHVWIIYLHWVKNGHMNQGKWLGKYSLHGASGYCQIQPALSGFGGFNPFEKVCVTLRIVPQGKGEQR